MTVRSQPNGSAVRQSADRLTEPLLSQRFKDAFKPALAVVIVYSIALSMGWGNPYWAGFAAANCSLSTSGESLNKGLLRIGGTFTAFFTSLILIALFPQDRWVFFGAISIYLVICNYMMAGNSRWYFWYVAAFTVPILVFGSGLQSLNAFDTVVLRAQLTTLGIVTYTLVAAVLWPSNTRDIFEGTVSGTIADQRRLFQNLLTQLDGEDNDAALAELRNRVVQGAGSLDELLNGAELNSLEIWEVRRAWRHCTGLISELNTGLVRWRQSFEDLREIDINSLLPTLNVYTAEIETRFEQIERILAGRQPTAYPQNISLRLEDIEDEALSHSQRASLLVSIKQLQAIDKITRSLFDWISAIRGGRTKPSSFSDQKRRRPARIFDPDHTAAVLRTLASIWLALLAWIYLPDIPASSAFICIIISGALMLIIMPQFPVKMLVKPILLSLSFATVVHIFILPRLDGFPALAVVIFVVTFAICYLFAKPQQAISKSLGITMFLMLSGIGTPQVYSFMKSANIGLAAMLVLVILAFTTYFPISFRPEVQFLRLLKRFFNSCEYLLDEVRPSSKPWELRRWRREFHLHEVATIPSKLASWWIPVLPKDALGESSPAQIRELQKCLEVLGWYIKELISIREGSMKNEAADGLQEYMQGWRRSIVELFSRLSEKPDAEEYETLRSALDEMLERLEIKIERTLGSATLDLTPEYEYKIYQLLGAYRGLSEVLVAYARSARVIDWPRLAENRF